MNADDAALGVRDDGVRELIVRALEQTSGNVTHAARLLKIKRLAKEKS